MQWDQLRMPKHQAVILELKGELDTEGIKAIEPVLLKLCEADIPNLILDCTQLRYINSLGLGLLVTGLKKSGELGNKFILAGLQEPIRHLFELVRFHRIFSIYESVGMALDAVDETLV